MGITHQSTLLLLTRVATTAIIEGTINEAINFRKRVCFTDHTLNELDSDSFIVIEKFDINLGKTDQ